MSKIKTFLTTQAILFILWAFFWIFTGHTYIGSTALSTDLSQTGELFLLILSFIFFSSRNEPVLYSKKLVYANIALYLIFMSFNAFNLKSGFVNEQSH